MPKLFISFDEVGHLGKSATAMTFSGTDIYAATNQQFSRSCEKYVALANGLKNIPS
jgi:hypothetical protein